MRRKKRPLPAYTLPLSDPADATMLKHRKVGDADLFLINEFSGPTHDRDWMLPESTWDQMAAHKEFENRFWMPLTDRLVFTMQIAVILQDDRIVLIDTGVGNDKPRSPGWQAHHNTPTLDWLKGVGAGREAVTDVVLTHLHGDHIGWNTIDVGNGWEPTFPNAVYHFPGNDYDAYKARFDDDRRLFDGGFVDSVLPVVGAGLVQFYKPGETLAGFLETFDAAGHSPGQCGIVFSAHNETIIFSADVFHSPIQVCHPWINSRWCELPDTARRTREKLLLRAIEPNTSMIPAHSFTIDGWKIQRENEGFSVTINN